jgi:hypothetical protein
MSIGKLILKIYSTTNRNIASIFFIIDVTISKLMTVTFAT